MFCVNKIDENEGNRRLQIVLSYSAVSWLLFGGFSGKCFSFSSDWFLANSNNRSTFFYPLYDAIEELLETPTLVVETLKTLPFQKLQLISQSFYKFNNPCFRISRCYKNYFAFKTLFRTQSEFVISSRNLSNLNPSNEDTSRQIFRNLNCRLNFQRFKCKLKTLHFKIFSGKYPKS